MPHRTTQEVFDDHLQKRKNGEPEKDVITNYAENVVMLTGTGIYYGHDGVRENIRQLNFYLPNSTFEYKNVLVEGEYAFLEWHGHSADGTVRDGADSFVIREGKIVMQSIHYTVHKGVRG